MPSSDLQRRRNHFRCFLSKCRKPPALASDGRTGSGPLIKRAKRRSAPQRHVSQFSWPFLSAFLSLLSNETKGPLFKVEDVNYGVGSKDLAPLYCYAISSKRYALFNLGADGAPILRKASAHGLGDKRAPYDEDQAPTSIPDPIVKLSDIGVDRWQHDLWYQIVKAALAGRFDVVPLDYHPALQIAHDEPICGDHTGHFELVQDLQRRSAIRPAGEAVQFPVGVSREVQFRRVPSLVRLGQTRQRDGEKAQSKHCGQLPRATAIQLRRRKPALTATPGSQYRRIV